MTYAVDIIQTLIILWLFFKPTPKPEPVDLNPLMREAIKQYASELRTKGGKERLRARLAARKLEKMP